LNVTRKFSIKLGIQASYFQFKVDWEKLYFGDQIDAKYGFIYQTQEIKPEETINYIDFSAGILAYSSKVYGGIAAHHLTEPDESFLQGNPSPLPMKLTVHFGALLPLESNARGAATSYVSPNILYQQQQDFKQINLGLYVAKGPLVGGLWYRIAPTSAYHSNANSDAIILLLGVQQGMFKFGYSYDVTISKLAADTAGSHEFSFGLQFECKPKKRKFRTISCPSF
jgi:type IX secretion system PorP/SprF family membrane protein